MSLNFGSIISEKIKNRDKNTYIFFICIFIIITLALILRTVSYFDAKPLWHDEAPIALTVMKNGFLSMFDNVEANQKAPFFFWVLTKFTGQYGNYNELSLRVFPFIFSVLSVFLFYIFSRQILNNKIAIIIANFLFAVNYRLLYFAGELKQYAGDVFFFMLAILVYSKLSEKEFSIKNSICFILFSILIVLSSFPACFVTIGFILYKVFHLKKEEKKSFIVANIVLFLASFVYFIRFLLDKYITEMHYQTEYWASGFINFKDNINTFTDLFGYLFYPFLLTFIGLIFVLYGLYILYREKTDISRIILMSFAIVLIASAMKFYPLYNRTSLYLIPALIVIMLKPMDNINLKLSTSAQKLYVLCFALTLLFSINYMLSTRYDKEILGKDIYTQWNPRETLAHIQKDYKDGDVIFVDSSSESQFEYYTRYFNFYPKNVIKHNYTNETEEHFLDFINSEIKPNNTYWFYCVYTRMCEKNKIKYLLNWKNAHKNYVKDEYFAKKSYVLKMET